MTLGEADCGCEVLALQLDALLLLGREVWHQRQSFGEGKRFARRQSHLEPPGNAGVQAVKTKHCEME